jgi:hypothetical protein
MKKQLKDEQLRELAYIKDWCLTIMDFIFSKSDQPLILAVFNDAINNGYDTQNLRGMRYVYRDTSEWGRGLSLRDIEELNKILYEKFGEDLNTCSKRDLSKINKIIKKGKIANENEFRIVLSRIDEIYHDSAKNEEIEILNMLLRKYELSTLR